MHFVKAADGAAMTTRGMTTGFLKGAVIIGYNHQESIDIAIPILLNRNDKIEEASMSAFLIQVKRRNQRGSVNAYPIDAERLGFFPDDGAQNETPMSRLSLNWPLNLPPDAGVTWSTARIPYALQLATRDTVSEPTNALTKRGTSSAPRNVTAINTSCLWMSF